MTDTFHKALIIRFSSVGDIVLSSLLVRVFRNRFPEAQLDFCVKEEFAGLVRSNPNISHVITFPRNGHFEDLQQIRQQIRQTGYDLIIDIHDSLRSRYLTFGERVVRVNKRKLARFLLVKFKVNLYHQFGGAPGVALRYVEPVRRFGVEDDGKGLELFFASVDGSRIESLISDAGFTSGEEFIGVCPSAKHKNKMWLGERFAEASATLSRETARPVVLFGDHSEADRCNHIAGQIRGMSPESRILNLAGKISLAETAAMMDHCSVVLTNDSGLMHIAAARKRKIVAVFGPTVRELGFFPFGTEHAVVENTSLACRPCTHIGLPECPKKHFKCMNDITTAQVTESANVLLQAAYGTHP